MSDNQIRASIFMESAADRFFGISPGTETAKKPSCRKHCSFLFSFIYLFALEKIAGRKRPALVDPSRIRFVKEVREVFGMDRHTDR